MERMRDEMKWMEVEYTKDGLQKYSVSIRHQKIGKMQNGLEHEHSPNATATGTTLNNYYINAINYNNIINHHSNVNLQNMAQNVRWNPHHSKLPFCIKRNPTTTHTVPAIVTAEISRP